MTRVAPRREARIGRGLRDGQGLTGPTRRGATRESAMGEEGGVSGSGDEGSGEPIWEQMRQPPWVKAINATGSAMRRVGIRWPRLDAESMMARARRRAGLSDFGDERFREGLDVLIDSFNARDVAHAFGRLFFREYCTSLLVNRLKIQADLTRHPEILDVPVDRPLIITGLPRSGTTFLHRLMSEDPAGRTLLFWEALEPSPPPRSGDVRDRPEDRPARKTSWRCCTASPPGSRPPTSTTPRAPRRTTTCTRTRSLAGMLGFMFDVPDYVRWLGEQDYAWAYRYRAASSSSSCRGRARETTGC